MAATPVLFDDQFPEYDPDQARIKNALRRVAIGNDHGQWPRQPDRIRVLQKLAGGRSGALVVRVDLVRGRQHDTRIVKIGADAAREWEAYRTIFSPRPSVLCPPIEAVTRGVLEGKPDPDDAVVYADAEQFAAAYSTNLEALATRAANGEPGAVTATVAIIDQLLQLAPSVLYSDCEACEEATREPANRALGPAVRLRAARIDDGAASPAAGSAERRRYQRMFPDDLLLAALDLPGSGAPTAAGDRFKADSEVWLREFRIARDEERWIAHSRDDEVTVEIVPADERATLAWDDITGEVDILGTIEATRSALTWERIRQAVAATEVTEPGLITVGGTRVAHPYAALHDVLTRTVTGLAQATVHGDLNPRNVLIARQQPFLIDYAMARRNQPVLGDLAWLELNLLRGPLSAGLGFADIVRAQRLLSLSDRIATVAGSPSARLADDGLIAGLGEDQPRLTATIRILGTIRHHARLLYPGQLPAAQPWWREYAAQLLLAAHRMCKWPDDSQTDATWQVQLAVAAVATEQLGGTSFRLWDPDELAAAVAVALPLLPSAPDGIIALGDLLAGLGQHRLPPGGQFDEKLRWFRAGALTTMLTVPPARMAGLERSHYLYIDVQATYLRPGQRPVAAGGTSAVAVAADEPRLVVVGGIGAGKTALLDELEYRAIASPSGAPAGPHLSPPGGQLTVRLTSFDLARACAGPAEDGPFHPGEEAKAFAACVSLVARQMPVSTGHESAEALLAAGALHLMIDDFDRLSADGRRDVVAWLDRVAARFPRIAVTVCYRGIRPPAELADWPTIVLSEPADDQKLQYLARFRPLTGSSADGIAELIDLISDPAEVPMVKTLARTPLQLFLLASTSRGGARTRTTSDLIGVYVRELESRGTSGLAPSELDGFAQALAAAQVGSGEPGTTIARLAVVTEASLAGGWDAACQQLVEMGILAQDGDLISFRLPTFQDYFAARALQTMSAADRRELVLTFGWRDAFSMFVSMTTTRADVVSELVDAVVDADPEYAARLIRSAAVRPPDLVSWFAARQGDVLRDRLAGEVAWRRAAVSLATVARPAAYRQLLGVLGDAAVGAAAREFSLTALASACHVADPRHRARLSAELTTRLGAMLADPDVESSLRAAAIRAVGDLTLRGLELLIGAQIGPGQWDIAREAHSALRRLGVVLPPDLLATYQQAEATRLTAVERELPTVTGVAAANSLQAERYRLVAAIRGADRIAGLLARRFDFEIGDVVGELIDAELASADGARTGTDPRWLAFATARAAPPEQLLAAIVGQEPLAAYAAGHRLLRDRPELAGRAFERLAGDGRSDMAPLAAALAAPDVPTAAVEDFFASLFGPASEGELASLAGMAALTQTVARRDPIAGLRLAWRAHRYLSSRGSRFRLYWPWSSAMARYGGTVAQLDLLLSTGSPDGVDIAVDALASSGFLLTAGRVRPHEFTLTARDRLLTECAAADTETPRAVSLLQAAAATGLPDALTAMFGGHSWRSPARMISAIGSAPAATVAVASYGLIEVTPLAELLAALGYLARLRPGQDPLTERIHRLLSGLDCSVMHPSTATGRLIGLTFLGDCGEVIAAVGSGDRRLPMIARNAIEVWAPGPWTTPGLATPASIASRIAGRLAEPDIGPRERSILLDLKLAAERRAGALDPTRQHADRPPTPQVGE